MLLLFCSLYSYTCRYYIDSRYCGNIIFDVKYDYRIYDNLIIEKNTSALHNEIDLDIFVDFYNLNRRYQLLETSLFINLYNIYVINLYLDITQHWTFFMN